MGVPSSFILFPPFNALLLDEISVKEDISSSSPFVPPPLDPAHSSNLEHLVVTATESPDIIYAIEMDTRGYLAGLYRLSILSIYHPRTDGCWKRFLLQSDVQKTLKHLELSFTGNIPELVLPSFLALTSLEIEFGTCTYNGGLPPNVESALTNIHTVAPLLEYLSLTIKQGGSILWHQECDPYPAFASHDFVKRLPALREVHCALNRHGYLHEWGFEQHMEKKFPGIKEAGILTCSII
ncbi:hypothetical protein C8R44DRAFT_976089 [Mycena epipterygia]|nr:hypothetical protein C8R44DRAFT_976089 [Mycena epipterygia]